MSTVHEMAAAIFKELDGREPGPESTAQAIASVRARFQTSPAEFAMARKVAAQMFRDASAAQFKEADALEAATAHANDN